MINSLSKEIGFQELVRNVVGTNLIGNIKNYNERFR